MDDRKDANDRPAGEEQHESAPSLFARVANVLLTIACAMVFALIFAFFVELFEPGWLSGLLFEGAPESAGASAF